MLMEVRNQLKVMLLSIKYSIAREMLNKVTFFSNIIFMILNNASFIIQWIVIYSIKDNIGGYEFSDILLLWGLAASTYGISRFFFKDAFNLSDIINNGEIDVYLVQPKNVLLSTITSRCDVSALGDIIYGFIMLFISGFSLTKYLLFTLFSISGALMVVSISVILSSLSFFFSKSDLFVDTINSLIINFATYPGSIFKGITKIMLYTIIPVGIINYLPISLMKVFDIKMCLILILISILSILFAFLIFNKGLKKYSSSNLMNVRI